ncbi:hypothetical protein SAMN06297251_11478 [Fulvimarina manganoxydans]|uniref:Invasion protein IalB, involved in pathogenesis n=2 Tax=Fulvimarina manganoxydans TaxID=937218 RepID=A0A1W2DFB9_9HYPH|nr:hypothetical protein [Fulvimarina manganoxydans]SMC95822.1 hypothetical protein SAMN06297251_11478 [Fulvimarina manganoxydans]
MPIGPDPFKVALAAGLMMVFSLTPAQSQTWNASEADGEVRTGPTYEFDYSGLFLRCNRSTGRLHLRLDGTTGRYIEGSVHPLTISIAGRVFPLEGIVYPSELGENYSFEIEPKAETLNPLLDALAAGLRATVITPNDRYEVPLKGSQKAIERFRRDCPSV